MASIRLDQRPGYPTITSTASATASTVAERDANGDLFANSIVQGFTTTPTAAGTTTLVVGSTPIQEFTGSTTQTVKLPTTSVAAGRVWRIVNNSTGAVTVQSSGANTILIVAAGTAASFTALIATPTAAADWAGTTASVEATASTASTLAKRDAQANLSADSFIPGFATTVTSASPVTLTVDSPQEQEFTGSTAQTVLLPTTGIVAGQSFTIFNQSTASVTVQSSGANTVAVLQASYAAIFKARVATPTTAANWTFQFAAAVLMDKSATANTGAQRGSSGLLFAVGFAPNLSTTVTAAGTTTLVVGSSEVQVFTGATTQTLVLPTTSVLAGQLYQVINNSSGAITINSSGANLVKTLAAGASTFIRALVNTPTTAAHWYATA